jgi:hypothetical protein
LTAEFIIPWMISILPALGGLTSYMVSGFAGALLTIGLVSAWAYMTGNKDRR